MRFCKSLATLSTFPGSVGPCRATLVWLSARWCGFVRGPLPGVLVGSTCALTPRFSYRIRHTVPALGLPGRASPASPSDVLRTCLRMKASDLPFGFPF